MDIWKKIEALKERKDWTDHELARALGRESKSWLYNIRKGLAGPSRDAAFKLADLLEDAELISTEAERNAAIVAFLSSPEPCVPPEPAETVA